MRKLIMCVVRRFINKHSNFSQQLIDIIRILFINKLPVCFSKNVDKKGL